MASAEESGEGRGSSRSSGPRLLKQFGWAQLYPGPQLHTQFSEREEEVVMKTLFFVSSLSPVVGLRVSLVSLHDQADEETKSLRGK